MSFYLEFWVYFHGKPMWTIFRDFRKKGSRPRHTSDKSKKCQSVGNSGILSVVVCLCLCLHQNM